jgi:putative transposase
VTWYNTEHHHSGLAGFTPEQVFTGQYHKITQAKQLALDSGYQNHLERFVKALFGNMLVAHLVSHCKVKMVI